MHEVQCIFLREIVKSNKKYYMRLEVARLEVSYIKRLNFICEEDKIVRELVRKERKKVHM